MTTIQQTKTRKEDIVIYSEKYRKQAHIPDNEIQICWACNKPILDNDPIYVNTKNQGTKRRHVKCAIEKNCISKDQARDWIERLEDDMDEVIPKTLKRFLIR